MTDPPTGLLLVRHGEAICNVTGVVGGPRSCTGLTPLGREQARQLAARLSRGEAVTVMYTAPRLRVQETSRPGCLAALVGRLIAWFTLECLRCWDDEARRDGPASCGFTVAGRAGGLHGRGQDESGLLKYGGRRAHAVGGIGRAAIAGDRGAVDSGRSAGHRPCRGWSEYGVAAEHEAGEPLDSAAGTSALFRFDRGWSAVPVPAPALAPTSLTSGGTDSVWATGLGAITTAQPGGLQLLLHWNGVSWRPVALSAGTGQVGILAVSGARVWLQYYEPANADNYAEPVLLYYDGTRWQVRPVGKWMPGTWIPDLAYQRMGQGQRRPVSRRSTRLQHRWNHVGIRQLRRQRPSRRSAAAARRHPGTGGTPTYLVADSLGSVRGTVSASGTLTGSTAYDAWGNPQTTGGLTAATPFGYAGGYTDPDGLIYLINRYYDPATGQFTSLDPDVDQTLQPYAYTAGSPVNSTDPTGEASPECDGVCGSSGSGGNGPSAAVAAAIASPDRTTAHNLAVQYAIGDIGAQLEKRGESIFQIITEIKAPYPIRLGKKDYLKQTNGSADIAWVHDDVAMIWEVKSLSNGYTAAMEAAWYVDCLEMADQSAVLGFDLRGVLIGPGTGTSLMIVFTFPEGDWGGILHKQETGAAKHPPS
jgi:RHS repeat-associated protein